MILFMSTLFETCMGNYSLGFLPTLLHWFGVTWLDVGTHQGRIRAVQSLSTLVAYIVTGYLIDRVAAVRVFVTFLLFQVVVMTGCAFVFDIQTLYAASVLIGIVSCNALAAKCVAFQISNESNAPHVLNYGLSTPMNLAALVGPTIGGYLALPTVQYPQLFQHTSFLHTFPLWLPSIVIALMLLITFLLSFSISSSLEQSKQMEVPKSEQESLLSLDDSAQDCKTANGDSHYSTLQCNLDDSNIWSLRSYIDFLKQRNIICLFTVKCLYTLSGTGLPKLYSLWVLSPHSDGGMGYSLKESANLTACTAILLFFADLVVPAFILKLLGHRNSLCASLITLSLVISMFWLPARMPYKNVAFVTISLSFLVARVATAIAKLATWAMLKNIIPEGIIGRVMAVDSCLFSVFSILGDLMIGGCFSWSLSNVKTSSGHVMFPMNEPFTFYLLSMLAMLASFAARMCTKDAEKSQL